MTEEKAAASLSPFEQALGEITRLAGELRPNIGFWNSDWPSRFSQIEVSVDRFVASQTQLDDKRCKDLVGVIKARREKLSLSSGITTPILGICQQILAFGGAGIALTVGFVDKVKQFAPVVQKVLMSVGIFYGELIVLSLAVLMLYMLQARFRYPSIYFEKIGNAWPFFYYAAITPVSRNPLQGGGARFDASVAYAKDYVRFCERVLNETESDRLRAELQQYFLLMSYQAYVHQFALRLASLFMYGFIGAVATLIIMLSSIAISYFGGGIL